MSSHKLARRFVWCCVLPLVACGVRNTAPAGFLPTPEAAGQSVRGGWVDIEVATDAGVDSVRGEVLAISRDSLWIQPPSTSGVVVARSAIRSGKITSFRTQGSVAGWTTLGALSSVANGWLLLLTAPAWMVTGAFSHYVDLRASERDLPGDFAVANIDLRTVARFPQGMPVGMDASFNRIPRPR